jgi:hypothetical protein
MTFTIPISDGLRRLKKAGRFASDKALDLHVVGTSEGEPIDVQVQSIVVTGV